MKNVVCNIDANYYQHCAAMLTSLFENNKEDIFVVYILAMEVPLRQKQILSEQICGYNNKVFFIDVNKDLLLHFPIHKHDYPTLATYLRLFIPHYLPKEVEKVLYIDCDVIFEGSIGELYNVDITNYYVAAVEDAPNDNPTRLCYEKSDGYFNAGLMLLNVANLRKMGFTEKALAYIHNYRERIIFHDQDVMNALLHGGVFFLPLKWNLLDCYYRNPPYIAEKYLSQFEKCKNTPVIIHFSGPLKPWHFGCHHPLSYLYFKYSKLIPWGCKKKDYLHIFIKYKLVVALLICKGYTPYEAEDIRRNLFKRKK